MSVLDRLQWDVFAHTYRRLNPALAIVFLNSTAHLQHKYWREMRPDEFVHQPTQEAIETYGKAILFENFYMMTEPENHAFESRAPDMRKPVMQAEPH